MLVLSRNIGESIIIGDLRVTVAGVFNKKVQLGIINQRKKSGFSMLEGKREKEIKISENIKIKILRISATQISLGIKAPPEVRVLRDKLAGQTYPLDVP